MPLNRLRDFLKLESASGIILCLAAAIALIVSNSPWASRYQAIFTTPSVLFSVNDGLMTPFFLLVGLELKREFLEGELSGFSNILLPAVAALGGMLVPALFYCLLNATHPAALQGWAIPVATDIAFTLGVLSLFGKRVPIGLKLFLMALAIFDDLGAIIIIAVFHTLALSWLAFALACFAIFVLGVLNIYQVRSLLPYLVVGILLWVCVLGSGVHATLAGILLAFMIPLRCDAGDSPAQRLEQSMHPWVAFGVMPLFAFANAGISFGGLLENINQNNIALGIAVGLFVGKQVGVFGFTWGMIRLKWSTLPRGVTWKALYGGAVLCGIGFTMSLFLGTLAFQAETASYLIEARLGVLVGSVLSGIIGGLILTLAFLKKRR